MGAQRRWHNSLTPGQGNREGLPWQQRFQTLVPHMWASQANADYQPDDKNEQDDNKQQPKGHWNYHVKHSLDHPFCSKCFMQSVVADQD
jgi:hypothetical protein